MKEAEEEAVVAIEAEVEVEEEEDQVSTIFNVTIVKSMVTMQQNVITMRRKTRIRKMKRKK